MSPFEPFFAFSFLSISTVAILATCLRYLPNLVSQR